MTDYGLTAGKKATLVTETHIITCTIQNVRLRDPCAPHWTSTPCAEAGPLEPCRTHVPCGQDTPVKLVAPQPCTSEPCDAGRYQPEPPCCDPCSPCTPTPPKAGPCADLPCEPCCTPDPCPVDVEQAKLRCELAEQATERLGLDEFEVALETGVAIKRNV